MSISRRKFLSWMGLATGLAVAGSEKVNSATTKHFEGYPDSMAVLHDSVLCLGCRKCEEACNRVNEFPKPDLPFEDLSVLGQKRRTTPTAHTVVNRYESKGSNSKREFYYNKRQCNHCLEPACASACFVGAFKKSKEGAVVYNAAVCVGCRYCMIACPFDIPTYEYDNAFSPKVMKCTMCHSRVLQGQLPGCVDSCPVGALIFGKRSEVIKIARNRIEKNYSKYIDHIYGENEMGGTSWLYLSGTDFNNIGLRTDLGFSPAGEFTAPALSAVPIIVGLWPVLLTGIYAITCRKDKIANEEKNIAVMTEVTKIENRAKAELDKVINKAKSDKLDAIKIEVKKALDKVAKLEIVDGESNTTSSKVSDTE